MPKKETPMMPPDIAATVTRYHRMAGQAMLGTKDKPNLRVALTERETAVYYDGIMIASMAGAKGAYALADMWASCAALWSEDRTRDEMTQYKYAVNFAYLEARLSTYSYHAKAARRNIN